MRGDARLNGKSDQDMFSSQDNSSGEQDYVESEQDEEEEYDEDEEEEEEKAGPAVRMSAPAAVNGCGDTGSGRGGKPGPQGQTVKGGPMEGNKFSALLRVPEEEKTSMRKQKKAKQKKTSKGTQNSIQGNNKNKKTVLCTGIRKKLFAYSNLDKCCGSRYIEFGSDPEFWYNL